MYTNHSAVEVILEAPNPSGKHARWWTQVYGSGVGSVKIIHRSGKSNINADTLSRNPQVTALGPDAGCKEIQVPSDPTSRVVGTSGQPMPKEHTTAFGDEQQEGPDLLEIITFLQTGELPADDKRARRIALQSPVFTIEDGILYFVDAGEACHSFWQPVGCLPARSVVVL